MNTEFERVSDGKDEWLTPKHITDSLGEFDLDPCSPIVRPWDTARNYFTIENDGLSQEWGGRVWLNPPYGNKTKIWIKRMAEHGNGIALTFARTETKMFHDYVWNKADAILFLRGRLQFCHVTGEVAANSAGAPSCLIAYGESNTAALIRSGIAGKIVRL